MIARAAQALTRLILEGGLPDDVIELLSQAQQSCMATATSSAGDEPEDDDADAAGENLEDEEVEEDEEAEKPEGEDPAYDTSGGKRPPFPAPRAQPSAQPPGLKR
jgi:hypothetical protein